MTRHLMRWNRAAGEVDGDLDDPALAVLAVLDAALVVTACALRAVEPGVDRAWRTGEPPVTTAARTVVDVCDMLLFALDDYRARLRVDQADRARRRGGTADWPF